MSATIEVLVDDEPYVRVLNIPVSDHCCDYHRKQHANA